MVLSLVLLVLFQGYWLRNTYRDEFDTLRREVNVLLRETALRQQMQQMTVNDTTTVIALRGDTGRAQPRSGQVVVMNRQGNTEGAGMRFEIRMGVPLGGDSTKGNRLAPARMNIIEADRHANEHGSTRSLIAVAPLFGAKRDTKMLDTAFGKALAEAQLPLAYQLHRVPAGKMDSVAKVHELFGPRFVRRVGGGPGIDMALAEFHHPFWYIGRRMTGQLLFALLMLGITATAFIFLYRNLQQQHRLAEQKNEFISNVTHELKTPIATVGVAIEALRNFNAINDPARTAEYLEISANELQRLSLLVDKVLRLQMFEQDRMELRLETVDLRELAEEVAKSMRLQLEKAGAQFDMTLPAAPIVVQGDRLHLLSVLYNLLDNAIKYGGQPPSISLQLQQVGHQAVLSVADRGMGIPAAYRQRVFEKFFRVPHGNTHNIKGYGLGLSYVAAVLQKHRGSIVAEPGPDGTGSRFVVTLPVSA